MTTSVHVELCANMSDAKERKEYLEGIHYTVDILEGNSIDVYVMKIPPGMPGNPSREYFQTSPVVLIARK